MFVIVGLRWYYILGRLSSVASLHTSFFLFMDSATTQLYTLSLHDALPISTMSWFSKTKLSPESEAYIDATPNKLGRKTPIEERSEEHTSELQSLRHLVCRLLLEKKKQYRTVITADIWCHQHICAVHSPTSR